MFQKFHAVLGKFKFMLHVYVHSARVVVSEVTLQVFFLTFGQFFYLCAIGIVLYSNY